MVTIHILKSFVDVECQGFNGKLLRNEIQ